MLNSLYYKEFKSAFLLQNKSTFLDIKCEGGYKINKFCCNKLCRFNAFSCSEDSCTKCPLDHQECEFRGIDQLSKKIKKRIDLEKEVGKRLVDVQQKIMVQLKTSNIRFLQDITFGNKNDLRDIQGLKCGKGMSDFFGFLCKKESDLKIEDKIHRYKADLQKTLRILEHQRENFFETIFQQKQQTDDSSESEQVKKEESIFQMLNSSNFGQEVLLNLKSAKIDSLILQETPENKSKLSYLFKNLKNFSSLQRLFRASDHDFKSQEFHKHCDGYSRTLTLIRTEFNRVLAAYTECKWTSCNYFVNDSSQSSFILQLEQLQQLRIKVNKKKRAIYDHTNFGPCFGDDIVICDRCNINNDNRFTFQCYNNQRGFRNNQRNLTAFCGAKQGSRFKVVEYEVFQVIEDY